MILTNQTLWSAPPEQLGGKAANLCRLQKMGYRVPHFVVLPQDTLQNWLDPVADIEAQIREFVFPDGLVAEICGNFKPNTAYFAVRSSAQSEDSSAHSFAGQFETKLYVSPEQLPEAIRAVWLSAFSGRVHSYADERAVQRPVGISVIIQEMVAAEKAGVAFGIHPTEGDRSVKVISAVWGLGEGLVSGELDADTFVVRSGGSDQTLANKPFGLYYDAAQKKVVKTAIQAEKQDISTLNSIEIAQIKAALEQLRQQLGQPQDIEFAFADGLFYLLQTRPITQLDRLTDRNGRRMVWDNSNIIESYPGVTTPLTFSFIIRMYEAVYVQLAALLGVSAQKVADHRSTFANMLGLLRGRVYYNLESWYVTLSLVPGYAVNARFMETMMGVKERFDLPQEQISRTRAWLRLVQSVFKMIGSLLRLSSERTKFKHTLDGIIADYNACDFDQMSPHQLMERYLYFEDFLVKRWKAPLVNDFFAMIYFGLLKKQCEKISSESGNLHNDLLAGSRDIVSTEPVRRILDITATVLDHASAADYFKNHTAQEVWENLWQWPDIQQKVQDYLATFGERTVGELKLETITYTQDPLSFIEIVQSYVAQGIRKRLSNEEEHIRAQAEATARAAMRGKPIKGALFWFLVRKTRILVSARENLRYERTRGFGMVRRMFLAIGKQFYAEHLIEQPRDIFYLTRDEIFDFIKGTSVSLQIKPLIALRQTEYAQYATEGPLAERIITHGVVYHANDFKHSASVNTAISDGSGVLKGLGCSAGIVRGRVRVVHQAHETRSLDGDILVTSSTDPGWVTLFPSASAILVERGSLLSHSAIVSRELGIPCVVGISGLLQTLQTGDIVEMDGTRGTVTIISQNAQS